MVVAETKPVLELTLSEVGDLIALLSRSGIRLDQISGNDRDRATLALMKARGFFEEWFPDREPFDFTLRVMQG